MFDESVRMLETLARLLREAPRAVLAGGAMAAAEARGRIEAVLAACADGSFILELEPSPAHHARIVAVARPGEEREVVVRLSFWGPGALSGLAERLEAS